MGRYDTVIWDWNGTWLDDVGLCLQIANEWLAEHSIPALTRVRCGDIFDFPVYLYWERAGFDLKNYDFKRLSAEFCRRFERDLNLAPLFPAAEGILTVLQRTGKGQFLAFEH